jgi:hypothetical protein
MLSIYSKKVYISNPVIYEWVVWKTSGGPLLDQSTTILFFSLYDSTAILSLIGRLGSDNWLSWTQDKNFVLIL